MKKNNVVWIFAIALLLGTAGMSRAQAKVAIGSVVDDFKLNDTSGREQAFKDLRGKNGAVIVFISSTCPVVAGYNERINKLAADYKTQGVNMIGINSNVNETLAAVKKHAADNYAFPVLVDKNNAIADKLNAYATPEAFAFDASGKLVYSGAVDNDKSGRNVTDSYLRDALDAHLAGKPIAKAETKAIGCTIKRAN